MSKIVCTGSMYQMYGNDLKIFEKLPAQVYSVRSSKNTGYFLEQHAPIEIKEDKIYGVHMKKVEKVLNAFPKFNKNLGVILSGNKGIGKSLFAKILSVEAVKQGLPVIIVDTYIPGIASFIESIDQEVLVMFDEFDKTFGGVKAENGRADPQTELLTLFDGLAQGKKLFVITCNNLNRLNDYLVNRPGRFHYHFRFEYPVDDEIIEYMHDKLEEKYYGEIEKVVSFSKRVNLNYDCLRAIAFELNTGLPFEEAIKDMNIINLNSSTYILTLYTKDGKKYSARQCMDLFDKTGERTVEFYDDEGDEFYARFSVSDVRLDHERMVDFVAGNDISLQPYTYADKDERNKIKNMVPDRITFVKEKQKVIHYNLTA